MDPTLSEAAAARVLDLLAQSLSVDNPHRGTAERELEQMLQSPASIALVAPLAAHTLVLPGSGSTALALALAPPVRLAAVLWLKQLLKRQWRAAGDSLTPTERVEMRQALLFAVLHEPDTATALHLALTLAHIARAEFPSVWTFEDLFAPLLQALQTSGDTRQLLGQRSVALTYRVVQELATRRLMAHRKQFALLAVETLPQLQQHWHAAALDVSEHLWTHCQLSGTASAPEVSVGALQTATERLQLLLTLTKLLATLFLNAFRDLAGVHSGELVRSALIQFYERLETFMRFRFAVTAAVAANANADAVAMLAAVDKCSHRIASIVVSLQKAYAIEFRAYLPPFLTLFWNVLGSSVSSSLTAAVEAPRRLQIEALQFFANVLSCRLYKRESLSASAATGGVSVVTKVITAGGDVSLTDAMVLEALHAVTSFFSSDDANSENRNRFEVLQQLTVMHYMRLSAQDLDEWASDPEAFSALSESLTAHESVRACAENLFLTLLQNYPEQTLPGLTQLTAAATSYLDEIATGSSGSIVADADHRVLDIDAVLLAIGLGCYDLHSVFEFEPWFTAKLAPVLVSPSASVGSIRGLPVLRYRIVWLVSCWLAQLSTAIRPRLYETLLHPTGGFFAQQPNADLALQLRVVQTLEAMVTDWGFDTDAFAPFLPRALECLVAFFPQTTESESKLKILGCLEAIVQACSAHAVALSEHISAPLPFMWVADSDASNLVRGKILQLLSKLLECVADQQQQQQLGSQSSSPALATERGVQTLVHMSLQVVRFATDVSNPDEVFLMETGLEVWSRALAVSTAYTEELHTLFMNVVRLLKRDYEYVTCALTIVKQYVRLGNLHFWQAYHASVVELFVDVVGSVKAEAAVQLARAQELVVAVFQYEQVAVCAPVLTRMVAACVAFVHKDADREPEMVVVAYLSVLARLLMQHEAFAVAHVLQNDQTVLGDVVVDLLVAKFFSVGSSSLSLCRRKVWALALCALLPALDERQSERSTGQILELTAEVLDEEHDLELERAKVATVAGEEDEDWAKRSSGAFRAYRSHRTSPKRVGSAEDDAVMQTDLKAFASTKLREVSGQVGAARFEQLLLTVDSSVLRKLQS